MAFTFGRSDKSRSALGRLGNLLVGVLINLLDTTPPNFTECDLGHPSLLLDTGGVKPGLEAADRGNGGRLLAQLKNQMEIPAYAGRSGELFIHGRKADGGTGEPEH